MKKSEIIEYLMSIIEHGSDQDLVELYNAYTGENLTMADLYQGETV